MNLHPAVIVVPGVVSGKLNLCGEKDIDEYLWVSVITVILCKLYNWIQDIVIYRATYDLIFPDVFSKYCKQPAGPIIKMWNFTFKHWLFFRFLCYCKKMYFETCSCLPPCSSPQRYWIIWICKNNLEWRIMILSYIRGKYDINLDKDYVLDEIMVTRISNSRVVEDDVVVPKKIKKWNIIHWFKVFNQNIRRKCNKYITKFLRYLFLMKPASILDRLHPWSYVDSVKTIWHRD